MFRERSISFIHHMAVKPFETAVDGVEPVPSALESEHAQEGESPSLAELPASN